MIAHNNLVIAESGNIITYLLTTFGSDSPFSTATLSQEKQIRNNYYLHYAEGSLMVCPPSPPPSRLVRGR